KAMQGHKDTVVQASVAGIEYLFKKNKIDTFIGTGTLLEPGKIKVAAQVGESETVEAKTIVIATGSDSTPLKGIEIDETRIVTSTGALLLEKVPQRLVVIGAGVIGLELGSVWRRLGSQVTVVEY